MFLLQTIFKRDPKIQENVVIFNLTTPLTFFTELDIFLV